MFDRVLIEAFLLFFGPSIFTGEGKGDEVSFTEEFVPRGSTEQGFRLSPRRCFGKPREILLG